MEGFYLLLSAFFFIEILPLTISHPSTELKISPEYPIDVDAAEKELSQKLSILSKLRQNPKYDLLKNIKELEKIIGHFISLFVLPEIYQPKDFKAAKCREVLADKTKT